jgi:hypothetical protein
MAAGLGFKDFVTGEVLTAADVDGYLMQGTWVFANAAARTAAVTSPQEGNMSYLKDTNSTEYYSGSAWVAVAGASGGMTLISTTSLTGSSVTLSSIPQTYKNLQLVVRDFYPATSGTSIGIKINADSGSNYSIVKTRTSSTSVSGGTGTIISLNDNTTESGNADTNNSAVFNFYDYTQTLRQVFDGLLIYNTTGAVAVTTKIDGSYIPSTSAAVTSLVIGPVTGNFGGGTALLYGVS